MRSFFHTFFAVLFSLVLIVLIVAAFSLSRLGGGKVKIKDHSYLVVDIYGKILEYDPPTSVMGEIFGGEPETLQRILDNLEKARVDGRIDGVILKVSASNTAGLAKLQEIRKAVKRVRKSGKKVLCYSDSMDRWAYYLAASCDSIFLAPPGDFSFLGITSASEHVKGMLDKLGIKPNVHKIREYKSAAEMVTRRDMSGYARENKEWLLDEFWDMFVKALKEDRGIDEERVAELMKHALFTAAEAKEAGLVDKLYYWDEIEAALKREGDKELRTVSSKRYAEVDPSKLGIKGKKKIAVIHAQGTIGGRKNRLDPFLGPMMGHESICAQFRKAREDKDVVAIVFRVDSPGGEGLASDLISRELEVTSKKVPVVVSMVDVAASGGYYISYKADRIVADPMTITGSIGSISAKFNMKGFFDKIGVDYDFVTKGPNALLMSSYRDFSEEEWKIFTENHLAGFNRWLEDVAEKRGMDFEEAEKLAYGRVWSGRQARENGLVDELGDLNKAVEIARELAGIPSEEKVTVVHFPKKKGLLEVVLGSQGMAAAVRWIMFTFIHEELAETWNSLTGNRAYIMEPIYTR